MEDQQPVMRHYRYYTCIWFGINSRWFENAARPFLSADDMLYVTNWTDVSIYWRPGMHVYHLAALDLKNRKLLGQRRFYTDALLVHANWIIREEGPKEFKALEELPHKDQQANEHIAQLKEILADTVPDNLYGPFLPFSRLTSRRYGVPFELRTSARTVSMVYDREAVKRALGGREDPEGLFARAELCMGESRLEDAARLLEGCLGRISSEDVDFRSMINQQLYVVHKRLARSGVRAGAPGRELANCLGMSRTVGTLGDEIETLFALSEAYERKGDYGAAERMLRNAIGSYGHYEYPVPSALGSGSARLLAASQAVLDRGRDFVKEGLYRQELGRGLELLSQGMPLYFSALSPLEKDLTVRTGESAAARLAKLQGASPEFAKSFESNARVALAGKPEAEQLHRLWEFPATAAAQAVVDELFRRSAEMKGPEGRQKLWRLADLARICALKVPEAYRARVTAPAGRAAPAALVPPFVDREDELQAREGTAWLVLERRDDLAKAPDLLFLGGRVQKRFDSKFL